MNWKFLLRLCFSILLLGVLAYSFDWREVMLSLWQINGLWLLAAFVLIVLAIAVSVIKWNMVLQALNFNIPWKELWKAYWIGIFFNNFLPSSFGGDAARILYSGKETGNYPGISLSVIVERILATVALALIGLGAALWLGINTYNIIWLFLLLLGLSLALLGVLLSGRLPRRILNSQRPPAKFLQGLASYGSLLRTKKSKLWWALYWSLMFQIVNVVINYAILLGLPGATSSQLGFHHLLAIIPATAAIAMLPLAVNGYGIREGAYIFLLAPFGVSETIALSASLLYAFSISFLSLWGGLMWLVHRRKENLCEENGCGQKGRRFNESKSELL